MPNKRWYNLKDPVDYAAAKKWSENLRIPDLTTRELEHAVEIGERYDLSDREIRERILEKRKRT